MDILIPVASGLEQTVKRQLLKLGYEKAPAENGRVSLCGDWQDVARLNVFLRSGERVLLKLAEFPAKTFDELFDGVYAIDWENYLTLDSQILMDGKSVQSALAAIKVSGGVCKKAVIRRLSDKLKTTKNSRVTFSETGARSIVGVSIYKDVATITLDTSGDGLHKRGYRNLSYTAPLKETLAAALIDNTFYNPDADEEKPFADLFCGSGTLPIEAALKGLNVAAGKRRNFDFENWRCAPNGIGARAKEEATDKETLGRRLHIFASDINPKAIEIAKYHAKRAGVENYISFRVQDARKFQSQEKYGVLLSNPPYGERLSDAAEVQGLMRDLFKTYRALPDWNAYIFTALENFERYFGKTADKKKKLFNANLPCGLYSYFGKPPKSADGMKNSKNGD
ncbi:MAG: class I SAM-dependent RNA methyltransferase [Clostridia bacterium]|nr:class I SAM-dependent RNA methyltransferase [Clostridia bacterium]